MSLYCIVSAINYNESIFFKWYTRSKLIRLLCWLTCPIIAIPVPSGMFTVRLKEAFLAPTPISTDVFGPGKSFDRNERKPIKRIELTVIAINEIGHFIKV